MKVTLLSPVHIFRNKLNALLGDDPQFTIYDIDTPLPDGTIEKREDGRTLNIVCSNATKLVVLQEHLGNVWEDGMMKVYIDYYFDMNGNLTKDFEKPNTALDIALLFEGNPHFSKMYSGVAPFGFWWCVAFKPELIQYHNEDASSLHGYRSCAMEDIAKDLFRKLTDENRIFFSTEMKEEFAKLYNGVDKKFVLYHIVDPTTKVYYVGGKRFNTDISRARHYATVEDAKSDQDMIMKHEPDLDIQIGEDNNV